MTQALGTFGVRGRIAEDAHEVLAIAEEYRVALCALYQERHERTIDLRNERFPALWNALVEWESAKARCAALENEIKAHHAKIRDRNAVKVDQRGDLEAARAARASALEMVKAGRAQWAATLTAWRRWFGAQADWKNVKALAKRRVAYAAMRFPTGAADLATVIDPAKLDASLVDFAALETYGRLDMECDLRERELSAEYQSRGLASGIRGEIDEASAPKLSKNGTGTRYVYGRPPDVRPWRKLTIQFVGGLSLDAAQEGTSQFRLTHEGGRMWRVQQQIGTASNPRLISYRVNMHRPFPPGTRLQRWSLCVTGEPVVLVNKIGVQREVIRHRATVIPIVAANLDKPVGSGVLHCRLSWRRVPGGGVQVAEFRGPHVSEKLILPAWLVEKRMEAKATLAGCDSEANEFLALLGERPQPRRRQGVVALRQYCFTHPDDAQARSLLDSMVLEVHRARRETKRAIRCIEKVYETVSYRVCRLHGELALKETDLEKKKRYDKRNLLAQDAPPEPVRELMHAVAPGKLKAMLEGYGLLASDEVVDWDAGDARGGRSTDVFSSWVDSLGRAGEQNGGENGGSRKAERKAVSGGGLR